jgi:hypothetical protein
LIAFSDGGAPLDAEGLGLGLGLGLGAAAAAGAGTSGLVRLLSGTSSSDSDAESSSLLEALRFAGALPTFEPLRGQLTSMLSMAVYRSMSSRSLLST